jgi:uracil-DNA glycosylase
MDATPFLPPPRAGKRRLAEAVQECRGCPLWQDASQAVFGEGPLKAGIVLVGERGKRRIHDKPTHAEATACLPWLERELALLKPRAVVALGATAAQELFGRDFRVSRQHGELVESRLAPLVTATIHPSAVLRARDDEERRELRDTMVADLRIVAG